MMFVSYRAACTGVLCLLVSDGYSTGNDLLFYNLPRDVLATFVYVSAARLFFFGLDMVMVRVNVNFGSRPVRGLRVRFRLKAGRDLFLKVVMFVSRGGRVASQG